MSNFKTLCTNIYMEHGRVVARLMIDKTQHSRWFKAEDHDDPIRAAMEYVEWMRNKPIYHPLGTCPVADQFIRLKM